VIVSTPKGMNHYYKMWTEAVDGTNGFKAVESHWSDHPLRNKKWANEQLAELGKLRYNQEIECKFLGSSATLIDGEKLGVIPKINPIAYPLGDDTSLAQFVLPQKGHAYVITVDVGRGADLDYSTFTVIDISVNPYAVVATYRNNTITTLVYPEVIYKVGKWYNSAYILVETNDLGQQVADILFYDLEYENMYMSHKENIKEGGVKTTPGVRTTKRSKMIGCENLKNLIEEDNLVTNDVQILDELTTFIRVGQSFKAEEGKHDDLAMCLVIFGYLTGQPVFKDLFDVNLREKFVADRIREVEEQFLPIGFFDNGGDIDMGDTSNPFRALQTGKDDQPEDEEEKKTNWDLMWTAVDQ
jgi:hypothetical protein